MDPSIMVTGGVGQVGSVVSAQIAKISSIKRLLIVDHPKTKARGEALRDTLRVSALMSKAPKEIEFYPVDLLKPDDITALLQKTHPSALIQVASLMSFYDYVDVLEPRLKKSGFQHHMPAHSIPKDYVLTSKIMEGIRESDLPVGVVNLCFPDFVNHLLAIKGLEPHLGAGNLDVFVYMIRWLVAQKFKVEMDQIKVELVGHHALEYFVSTAPFILHVFNGGMKITHEFDTRHLLSQAVQILSDPQWYQGHDLISETTAQSAVKNAIALLSDELDYEYAPGPKGLLGGCGAMVGKGTAKIALPQGSSLKEVQEINHNHAILDGVQDIKKSGEVIFTEETKRLCKEILGLNWEGFHIDDAYDKTKELQKAYRNVAKR